jgi:protein-L-isoaspartate(D-aspartate) O-methyltransferase
MTPAAQETAAPGTAPSPRADVPSAGAEPRRGAETVAERPESPEEEPWLAEARARMVRDQIEARGVADSRVLEAMRAVPRHAFVPLELIRAAYQDHPLPIGHGQTISQPYIVALMSELLEVAPGEKILEVGTGSGYQAAVLSAMGAEVWTIEIVEPLGLQAKRVLEALAYPRIRFRVGDGYRGWPEAAPFDGIIVTAAPDHVPQPLVDQLAPGGRMVIPVGSGEQELLVLSRTEKGMVRERSIPVRFVPMTGEAEERRP